MTCFEALAIASCLTARVFTGNARNDFFPPDYQDNYRQKGYLAGCELGLEPQQRQCYAAICPEAVLLVYVLAASKGKGC